MQAVQILVARFRDLQQLADPNAFLSVSLQSATRLTRAFSRNMEAASTSRQSYGLRQRCARAAVLRELFDVTVRYVDNRAFLSADPVIRFSASGAGWR